MTRTKPLRRWHYWVLHRLLRRWYWSDDACANGTELQLRGVCQLLQWFGAQANGNVEADSPSQIVNLLREKERRLFRRELRAAPYQGGLACLSYQPEPTIEERGGTVSRFCRACGKPRGYHT